MRTATIVLQAVRSRACTWTLPVATQGTPEALGQLDSSRFAAAVVAPEGALELTRKRLGPKMPSSRGAAAAPDVPASTREATAPSAAQPDRQTRPSEQRSTSASVTLGSSSIASCPGRRPSITWAVGSDQPSRAQRRVCQCEAVIRRHRLV